MTRQDFYNLVLTHIADDCEIISENISICETSIRGTVITLSSSGMMEKHFVKYVQVKGYKEFSIRTMGVVHNLRKGENDNETITTEL